MAKEAVPAPIPVLPRTKSSDLTQRMYMTDHTLVKQEGPPDIDQWWDGDTDVDVTVAWYE